MSGELDPHRGTSSYQDIYFYPEINQEECAELIRKLHRGQFRVVLKASYFLAKDRRTRVRQQSNRYFQIDMYAGEIFTADQYEDLPEDFAYLDGRIHGVRLLPLEQEDEYGNFYTGEIPHAILTDVVRLSYQEQYPPQPISEYGEMLLVPIENIENGITVYTPNKL